LGESGEIRRSRISTAAVVDDFVPGALVAAGAQRAGLDVVGDAFSEEPAVAAAHPWVGAVAVEVPLHAAWRRRSRCPGCRPTCSPVLDLRHDPARVDLADARALAERRRLAGSLGDLLDERLTMIAAQADRVQALGPTDPEQAGAEAAETGSQARAILSELRAALAELQTVSLAAEARSAATLAQAGMAHGHDGGFMRG
jgi:signal transduction histidine kinase